MSSGAICAPGHPVQTMSGISPAAVLEPELAHALDVALGDPGEHLADGAEVEPGHVVVDDQLAEPLASGRDLLRLGDGLAHQATAPQRQASADQVVGLDAGTHPVDHEVGPARVLERGDDELLGALVEVARDLTVEVVGEPVTDVGLDQGLPPVGRPGVEVERVEALAQRLHGCVGVDVELHEPVEDRLDLGLLGGGHGEQGRLVLQRRSHLRVVGQPLDGRDLAVGDRAQDVDDGSLVDGITERILTTLGL